MFVSILLLSFSHPIQKFNVWMMCAFWPLRSLSVHKLLAGMGTGAWHLKKHMALRSQYCSSSSSEASLFPVYHHLTKCISEFIIKWWSHYKAFYFCFIYPLFSFIGKYTSQVLLLMNSERFIFRCNSCTVFSDSGLHISIVQWSLLKCLVHSDKQNNYVHA